MKFVVFSRVFEFKSLAYLSQMRSIFLRFFSRQVMAAEKKSIPQDEVSVFFFGNFYVFA
jgi:hypothetical protein